MLCYVMLCYVQFLQRLRFSILFATFIMLINYFIKVKVSRSGSNLHSHVHDSIIKVKPYGEVSFRNLHRSSFSLLKGLGTWLAHELELDDEVEVRS